MQSANDLSVLRILQGKPGAGVYPPPTSGFDLPQPTTLFPTWTQNYAQVFKDPGNMKYLKGRILAACNCAISTDQLVLAMGRALGWYHHAYLDATYGPSTRDELQKALNMMNERVVKDICRQYRAQKAVRDQWVRYQHQPQGTAVARGYYQSDFDKSIELS